MPQEYLAEIRENSFKVFYNNGNRQLHVFSIYSITKTYNGKERKRLAIDVRWDPSKGFEPYEADIKQLLMTFLGEHTASLEHVDVSLFLAEDPTAVNSLLDTLMQSSTPAPVIYTIEVRPFSERILIPANVWIPLLSVNNRTQLFLSRISHFFELCESITDARILPRYISLPGELNEDQMVKEFMEKMPIIMYSMFSNTELVTFAAQRALSVSTVTLMQYMRAMKQYGIDMEIVSVLKHWDPRKRQQDPNDPTVFLPLDEAGRRSLPPGLVVAKRPDIEQLFVPQVGIFPEINNSTWCYYDYGIIQIDGVELKYTFPKIDMTMGTVLDMMTRQADPLHGNTVSLRAQYQLQNFGVSKGATYDWTGVELMATDYEASGFARLAADPPLQRRIVMEKHGVNCTYRMILFINGPHGLNVEITYTINRAPPENADPGVGGSGVQQVDTGAQCARCMKPVLLE
jgi:hypothetical protein